MQFRTRVQDGETTVDVIDASDGAVVRSEVVGEGQQFVATATTAHSAADLSFGEVETIPEADEAQPEGEAGAEDQAGEAAESPGAAQPGPEAEGAEAPADAGQTPAEDCGDGEQSA